MRGRKKEKPNNATNNGPGPGAYKYKVYLGIDTHIHIYIYIYHPEERFMKHVPIVSLNVYMYIM